VLLAPHTADDFTRLAECVKGATGDFRKFPACWMCRKSVRYAGERRAGVFDVRSRGASRIPRCAGELSEPTCSMCVSGEQAGVTKAKSPPTGGFRLCDVRKMSAKCPQNVRKMSAKCPQNVRKEV